MYAITPTGIGKKIKARKIKPDWPLAEGETFTVLKCDKTDVLAEDEKSLRPGTEKELNPPDTRTNAQKLEDKIGLNIDDIKTALGIT